MTDALRAKLKTLPSAPGVYFHKSADGEIIYVGKAAVLKNRVRQYFNNSPKDPKTAALVAEIADTDWVTVGSEMDALFLESEMVKRYMPRWNILLRDDKSTSYIRIDMKSPVPHIEITRNPDDDGANYYGPYFAKHGIIAALRVLRRVFPFYDKPFTGKKSLYTDIGLTPGIEVGKTTPAAYKRNLRKLIQYIQGNRVKLMKQIERDMKKSAATGHYEQAADLRNQLYGLQALATKIIFSDREFLDISGDKALAELQRLLGLDQPPARIEGYDISHQAGTNVVGSMVVFTNGVADRPKYRKFKLRNPSQDDTANMREIIARRLGHLGNGNPDSKRPEGKAPDDWDRPDLIILDGAAGQISAVRDLLDREQIPFLARNKSGDHGKNAQAQILDSAGQPLPASPHVQKLIARIDDESHRFAVSYHTLLKRRNMLRK
jgi:excinuclease ABC subunit C